MSAPALRIAGVSKRFGSVVALDRAELEVAPGHVHGLLGQNGSGKSTLVKVLTGFHAPDGVEVAEAWGRPLSLPLRASRDHGIAVIHQDLALVDTMTAAENVGVSTAYGRSRMSPVAWRAERRLTAELLDELGFAVDPEEEVGRLSAAERAAVAVARAIRELRSHADVPQLLVLDEPTAYLPAEEAAKVIGLMRSVAARGAAVIFISHRLAEVMAVCDRATVLRDGRTVGQLDVSTTSPRELIGLMLGHELAEFYPDPAPPPRPRSLLDVGDLRGRVLDGVTFSLREGEVLGVTGLVGQGQSELPYLVAGAERAADGTIRLGRTELAAGPLARRIRQGVILVPANRKRDGVWLDATATENISLPVLGRFMHAGVLRRRREQEAARESMQRLGVRPPEPSRALSTFSGGNQQKIVLAKWLQCEPRVLVLDEPTQGVDAGAKREILGLLNRLAADGAGVLLCSSDHEEVANVCHRVLVLSGGRVTAELDGPEVTEHRILEACHAAVAA